MNWAILWRKIYFGQNLLWLQASESSTPWPIRPASPLCWKYQHTKSLHTGGGVDLHKKDSPRSWSEVERTKTPIDHGVKSRRKRRSIIYKTNYKMEQWLTMTTLWPAFPECLSPRTQRRELSQPLVLRGPRETTELSRARWSYLCVCLFTIMLKSTTVGIWHQHTNQGTLSPIKWLLYL